MEAYPKSRIPQHPLLSLDAFESNGTHSCPSILDCGPAQFVTSGRMAIALALQHMGVGPNDKVLLPAYHCPSMVAPIVWAGAEPVFYRVNYSVHMDFDDVRKKLDPSVKALLITHYFGFPQDAPRARALCDEAGIALIEDCAHAFFGTFAGRPPGWYGDYAIASAMKFFPVYDGGCLVSSRRDISSVRTISAGAAFQIKAGINLFEQAFAYGRLPALKALLSVPMWLKDRMWSTLKRVMPTRSGTEIGPAASSGGYEFDPVWLDKRMTGISESIMNRCSRRRIVENRRRNFLLLLEGLRETPGARSLITALPDYVVPYLFPLVVDDPAHVFPRLKRMGVPLLRWEALDPRVNPAEYPVSNEFSRQLLQVPCHEDFTAADVRWMIDRIVEVLNTSSPAGAQPEPGGKVAYEMETRPGR